ncbi:M16 family metallopeptidase [Shewanella youngdeokensis]|uniref:Pitrilysin family protein n=1 Tax=Shewanella youngdeokensis TaxID=2999068 RepID=A0ABZ0K2X3_9GAMM|nr:pitrilysin family protein [Shewanella sp. DAU334]
MVKGKQVLSVLTLASLMVLGGCATTDVHTKTVDTGSFSMPAYEQVTLENGLTIYLMPQTEVPLITVNATIKVGAVNDTLAGMAQVTAASLMLGAGGQSKLAIEQQVDFLGANLASGAGKEGSYLQADFMAKDAETMLPLIQRILLSPDFDVTEFNKLRQRKIAGLGQSKESPRAVINRYYDKLIFAQHPYGNAVSGNTHSLAQLDVPQVRAFHQRFYQPANVAINVVGDFDTATMKAELKKLFGQWQNTATVSALNLKQNLPVLDHSKVLLVDKGDAVETTFLIGGKGVSRDNPDFVGLTVINTILGGRFTSWLNDELRVNAGLTYGARSGFTAYSAAGTFKISTFTKTATTKETIDLALKTYNRLWDKGLDQATLDSAKAYVKGQFPPKYETSGQLAGLMSDMYLFGFDDAFINEFQTKVDGLTLQESQRLIDTYFPKDNLQFVIIGNAAQVAPIAKQYGTVTQVDIKAVGFGD